MRGASSSYTTSQQQAESTPRWRQKTARLRLRARKSCPPPPRQLLLLLLLLLRAGSSSGGRLQQQQPPPRWREAAALCRVARCCKTQCQQVVGGVVG